MLNEAELIRRSQQGDKAAFEALLRLWARPIYAWLLPQVKDVHRAEDLTQETLVRAWKSIPSLNDPAKFKGWIFSIASRALIDQTKFDSRHRRSRRLTITIDENAAYAEAEINLRQEDVLDALQRLPTTYREVLSLRFLSGLSTDEIQARLGITNGSLRGLLHRGLKMLKDEMTPIGTATTHSLEQEQPSPNEAQP